jgi:hypothetical protein
MDIPFEGDPGYLTQSQQFQDTNPNVPPWIYPQWLFPIPEPNTRNEFGLYNHLYMWRDYLAWERYGLEPTPAAHSDNFVVSLSFHEDVTTPAAPPPPDRTASYYNRAPTVNSTTHIPWAPIDITIWSNGSVTSAVR